MEVQRVVAYDHFFCDVCRQYVYDETKGDPKKGIAPETRVDELPNQWRCPVCGAESSRLRACTLIDDFVPVRAEPAARSLVANHAQKRVEERNFKE
ncbi:MAG TPA: rubredoxin [Chroococcales cyanobacterium]